jgi:hypothetical protein
MANRIFLSLRLKPVRDLLQNMSPAYRGNLVAQQS